VVLSTGLPVDITEVDTLFQWYGLGIFLLFSFYLYCYGVSDNFFTAGLALPKGAPRRLWIIGTARRATL